MVTSKRLQKLVDCHRFDSGYLMLPYAEFLAYGMLRKHLSKSSKTLGKYSKVRFLSCPLKNPGFPRVFRILGQLLWLSVPIHACPCLQVLPL